MVVISLFYCYEQALHLSESSEQTVHSFQQNFAGHTGSFAQAFHLHASVASEQLKEALREGDACVRALCVVECAQHQFVRSAFDDQLFAHLAQECDGLCEGLQISAELRTASLRCGSGWRLRCCCWCCC
jgi:hypothetical protein